MTIGAHPAEANNINDLFSSLVLGFRHGDGGLVVTSGSYPSIAEEFAGTAEWSGPWRSSALPEAPDIPEFYVGITGSVSAYAFFNVEQTSAENPDYKMARLEAAAEVGDERAFWATVQAIDWTTRSPEDFIRTTQLALQAGAYLTARQISVEGAKRYPDHAELQKYARVLAPPKVTRSALPPNPAVSADIEWFKTHSAKYRGQWVAVKNGELLAVAPSIQELKSKVSNLREATVTRIAW